eukprot:3645361-Rhodomonas_salina.1
MNARLGRRGEEGMQRRRLEQDLAGTDEHGAVDERPAATPVRSDSVVSAPHESQIGSANQSIVHEPLYAWLWHQEESQGASERCRTKQRRNGARGQIRKRAHLAILTAASTTDL